MHLTGNRHISINAAQWIKGLILLLLGLFCLDAKGQNQTGGIKGRVLEAQTGKPLAGADVIVVGTYEGAVTNEKGNFRVKGIKPGNYAVKIKYLGYQDKKFTSINILPDSMITLKTKLRKSSKSLDVVEIKGKNELVKLETGKSSTNLNEAEIKQTNAQEVKDIVAMQEGVSKSMDGLHLRGGRVYENQYIVDGIDAQDPLAGTGFGLEVSSQSLKNLNIVTSGLSAEHGNTTSGLIQANIREGGDSLEVAADWQRDNLGFNRENNPTSWNTDKVNFSLGTPIPLTDKDLTLFTSLNVRLTDNYFGPTADQLRSSLLDNPTLWAPRQSNSFNHTIKLAYEPVEGTKITLLNQHSLKINQNSNSLRIVGFDKVLSPGFQYPFSLNLDNATTYTHRSNLTALNYDQKLGKQWFMNITAGRLFTNLRADANGRPFRDKTVDQINDPRSIVSDPVTVFNPGDTVKYVNPGPGLYNNGGISGLWHDHYVSEYTGKAKFKYIPKNSAHYFTFGWEHKEKEYQWIDVQKPWIGAPIKINDSLTTPSTRLGQSSDVWKTDAGSGALFFEDKIRYKGIVANLGFRFNYWAPGNLVDNAINNPEAPILDTIRTSYKNKSTKILGRRYKSRFLPRLRVSFPVTENNVLYFNYNHSMKLPHPRFVYSGLNPAFQDRSFLANLGNPDLDPETSVSYELGVKSRINRDLALTMTAFYNDKYDYIVNRSITIRDQTGRFVNRSFYVNQDYARIRGIEAGIQKRIGDWFRGRLSSSYQIATGKSNSARESKLQIENTGEVRPSEEKFLAWDRPFELKTSITLTPDSTMSIGSFSLENFRLFIFALYKSGYRYTPHEKRGVDDIGRPIYEPVRGEQFTEISNNWFKSDLKLSRAFEIGKAVKLSVSVEVRNLFNNKNAQVVNPVTGAGYQYGDALPYSTRNPVYDHPQNRGLPPSDPSRWRPQRQILYGIQLKY